MQVWGERSELVDCIAQSKETETYKKREGKLEETSETTPTRRESIGIV